MNAVPRLLAVLLSLYLSAGAWSAPGLPRSTPESQGIASADIADFVRAADAGIDTMNSFMLVRHGHVVAEGWWSPYDAQSPHVLYSLTKSFTATAVGLAITEGRLGLHDRIVDLFPDQAPADPDDHLGRMRVVDLLRMATGHESEPELRESPTPWVETFLAHPVPHRPGTHFLYNTPASHMLSAIVQQAVGTSTQAYLKPRLFEPLGIEEPVWLKSPQGTTLGGYGLSVRTEDIAKFGQLYLQKGLWQDRQLLPAAWVDAATSLQTANGSDPDSDWNQGYGYQFWRSRHSTYRGDGAFGQFCIVVPGQDTVIAITSGVADMQAVLDLVFARLLPALRAAPLPGDPEAHARLRESLSALQVKLPAGDPAPPGGSGAGGAYVFPANELGIEAVAFEFASGESAMTVRTAAGEERIPMGAGSWRKTRTGFAFGLDATPGVPGGPHAVAASGAWSADDRLDVKLVLYETPFHTTVSFRFDGTDLHLLAEPNLSFGPKRIVSLVGRREARW